MEELRSKKTSHNNVVCNWRKDDVNLTQQTIYKHDVSSNLKKTLE